MLYLAQKIKGDNNCDNQLISNCDNSMKFWFYQLSPQLRSKNLRTQTKFNPSIRQANPLYNISKNVPNDTMMDLFVENTEQQKAKSGSLSLRKSSIIVNFKTFLWYYKMVKRQSSNSGFLQVESIYDSA